MNNRFLSPSLLGLALLTALAYDSMAQGTAAKPVQRVAQKPIKLDADDKRVIAHLDKILRKRVKSSNGGKINFLIVPTERASEGYFSKIVINGVSAKMKKLYVSEISLNAKNVQIDVPLLLNENRVRTKKSTTAFRTVVSETDLTRMLSEGKNTAEMGLKVTYLGDRMRITGNINYALIKGPVDGIAKLRQGADHKVFLDILSMKLRGTEIPAFMKNQFANHINPVIDYENLPFNPPLKSIKVVGKKAFIST